MQAAGVCRQQPPQTMVAGALKNPTTGEVMPRVDSFWPQIPDTEWCGQWKLRPSAIDMDAIDLSALSEASVEGNA